MMDEANTSNPLFSLKNKANEQVFETNQELAQNLADTVSTRLQAAIDRDGRAVIALSGGSTPKLFFKTLSQAQLDWSKVTITLVDERFVPPSSTRSNARLIIQLLLQGNAALANFVPLYEEAENIELAVGKANDRLNDLKKPFDVVVLGMGADGHTASFFPDSAELKQLLDPEFDQDLCISSAASAGEPRLTWPLSALKNAHYIALHIEGKEKKSVLQDAFENNPQLPIRAMFDHAEQPIEIFWAP